MRFEVVFLFLYICLFFSDFLFEIGAGKYEWENVCILWLIFARGSERLYGLLVRVYIYNFLSFAFWSMSHIRVSTALNKKGTNKT